MCLMLTDAPDVTDDDKRIRLLKVIVNDLPPSHKDVLQFTIFHLARLVSNICLISGSWFNVGTGLLPEKTRIS